jgi:hypothetical protein
VKVDDEKPIWRRLFDSFDAEIAPQLESFVRTPQFADFMAVMNRLNAQASKAAADANRQFLEFWNVPSRNEIDELKQQVASLDRQLHSMTKALKEAQRGDS